MVRKIVELTPELAKEMLSNNYGRNRKIRRTVIKRYAEDIRDGKWCNEASYIQDPIMISEKGELINGQHRCHAVVEAGKSIQVCVLYDVPESVFRFLDNGESRQLYDFLDTPSAKSCSFLTKVMFVIEDKGALLSSSLEGKYNPCGDKKGGSITPTRQQTIDKFNEDPERVLHYVRLGEIGARYIGRKKSDFAIALFVIDRVGRGDAIERFTEDFGKAIPKSPQIALCRSYMTKYLMNPNFKSTKKWFVGCIFRAYDAYIEDRQLDRFNKVETTYSKYEKYIYDIAEKKKENK